MPFSGYGYWKFAVVAGVTTLVSFGFSTATAVAPPPKPLTLQAALAYSDARHSQEVNSARLDLETEELNLDATRALKHPELQLLVTGRRSDRAQVGAPNDLDDSRARLRLVQPIYDFERSKNQKIAAAHAVERTRILLANDLQSRRLDVMKRYFDVLNADLNYAVMNERMTISFLRFNRMREETDLFERHADVDVSAQESIYQKNFVKRQQAGLRQQETRRILAASMSKDPQDPYIPRDLTMPDLSSYLDRELPEYEILLDSVLTSNPLLAAADQQVESAKSNAKAESYALRPSLDAIIEANEWEQKVGTRDDLTISLQLKMPLAFKSQRDRIQRANRIAIDEAMLERKELELEIRALVFDLWQQLSILKVEAQASEVTVRYRDLYMDKSRSLYELEVRSDLGDAQAELLAAIAESTRIELQTALTWTQIDVLMGKEVVIDAN